MTLESGYFNPQGVEQNQCGQADTSCDGNPGENYLRHIRRGALAGLLYGLWGIGDAYIPSGIDYSLGASHAEAIFRAILVGVPTLLMFFRRGMVSALALTALAILNGASVLTAYLAGDSGSDALSFIPHIPFVVLFARAAWTARHWQKQNGGRS